ncbi:MAG: sulfate adenylyltransferase [Candidatus Glassbacteria bacterium]
MARGKENRMSHLVPPHGGKLLPKLLTGERLEEERKRAGTMKKVMMTSRETSDLVMMAMGAFSPLDGFMGREDYQRVVFEMHLSDGTMWPIPITLSVSEEKAKGIKPGDELALIDRESGELMGSMKVEDTYGYDKIEEARNVFGTDDTAHPGVAKVMEQGEVLIGGPVMAFSEGKYPREFGDYYARPEETRRIFEEKGWRTVSAFQVRNPIHRSHEYCTKIAMEVTDGLFIHPLVGKLKEGDIPADVRMRCYEVLIDNYYPKERVVLKVYPMEMRYGGPREALLHAIFRQNFGCSHLIVGRDHAGVGDYYGPFDAQNIFDELPEGDLHIKPLKIDWTFFCYKCQSMASMKTCPHTAEDRCIISGTKLRRMLAEGEMPPLEFSRPEILEILIDYYKGLAGKVKIEKSAYEDMPKA